MTMRNKCFFLVLFVVPLAALLIFGVLVIDREPSPRDKVAGSARSSIGNEFNTTRILGRVARSSGPSQSLDRSSGTEHSLARSGDVFHEATVKPRFREVPGGIAGLKRTGPSSGRIESLKRTGPSSGAQPVEGVVIELNGNLYFSDEEILSSLRLPQNRRISALKRVVRDEVGRFYRSHGFAKAKVELAAPDEESPIIGVEIEEGEVFILAEIQFKGLRSASEEDARSLYPEVGGPADWFQLRQSDALLEKSYQDAGFLRAEVKSRARVQDSSKAFVYAVIVEEGPLFHVGAVSVPNDLKPRFPLREGELFEQATLDQFVQSNQISQHRVILDQYSSPGVVEITILE